MMKLDQSLHFVLVVMATVLMYSMSPACSLPYGDLKTAKHNLKFDKRDRDMMDTLSRQIKNIPKTDAVPAVSLQVPTTSLPEIENETAISQEIMCNQKSQVQRNFSSCNTLQQVLSKHFSKPGLSQRLDTFYNAFNLADLFYSGLLKGSLNNYLVSSKEYVIRRGQEVCDNLLRERVKPRNVSSGSCSWHYTCTYNPDIFPSFKVEAQIDHQEYLDAERCNEVKMSYVTMFGKESCPEDPCGLAENWVAIYNQEIVVGFTAAVW